MALKEDIDNHKPFLDNKYSKWYMELVSKDCNDDYVERHHILPKSLYPEFTKCKWNIVKLSARKHFIAHMLLYRMFEHNTKGYGTMLKATRMMGRHSTDNRYMNSRLYETARIKCSIAQFYFFALHPIILETFWFVNIRDLGKYFILFYCYSCSFCYFISCLLN